MATITSKGQITIPKEVRDALGLTPGTQVEFTVEPGRVVMRKRIPEEVFRRWRGFLRDAVDGRTTDEILAELRGE
ncbi:MAG: AbrB/MazE/SpoVT family DNA-binding domain-containing protein [Chloroflexota bacterium]